MTCAAVRSLPRSSAESQLPVVIRGVVTVGFPGKFEGMVVQDETAGVYVDRAFSRDHLVGREVDWPEVIRWGTRVEIKGVTSSGHFAPIVCPTEIRVLGEGELPPAIPLSIAEVLDGKWDCQRVRLSGVIQSVRKMPGYPELSRLDLAARGGRIPIYSLEGLAEGDGLVDADVDVTGVVFTYFNGRGESVGARVEIDSMNDLAVRRAASADPWVAPEIPLSELRTFSANGVSFHRIRCTGIVTLSNSDHFFYLQKGQRGIRVETRGTPNLKTGDVVETAGFVEMAEHFGKLREALVRPIGHAARPTPFQVDGARVLGTERNGAVTDADDVDGTFGRLTGRLEKLDMSSSIGPRLFVESDGKLVIATLVNKASRGQLDHVQPGCELQIDGIIQVDLASGSPAQDYPTPVNFSMLVNSAGDIAVVHPAPWWTPIRLWLLLGGIGSALLVVLGWNWLLRRKVEKRSAELAFEIQARREAVVEFDATLRERERLAADLHDSLEQLLTSLALQLEAGNALREKAPARSANHLHLASQLLSRSREEVRRSVWDLRTQNLQGRTFSDALSEIVALLCPGSSPSITIETKGPVRPLPDLIGGHLLLLAREAVTNALKHASAQQIQVTITYEETRFQISVEDNGKGFDATHCPGPQDGHFGLLGMHERMKRLQGEMTVASAVGSGTRIVASVPAKDASPSLG